MAYTAPGTVVAGDVYTAAAHNVIVNDIIDMRLLSTNVKSAPVTVNTASTTSTSFVDLSGLSVNITPSSSSSKVLVTVQMLIGYSGANEAFVQLVRGSTAIAVGTSAGSGNNASAVIRVDAVANSSFFPVFIKYLDSPATTSATTYKVQWRTNTGTIYLNRRSDTTFCSFSSITVEEVAG